MNGPTHLGIGVAAVGIVVWGADAVGAPLSLATAASGAAVAALGSLAPDIDHRDATIGSKLPFMCLTAGLALLGIPAAFRLASARGGSQAGLWAGVLPSLASWPRWGGILVAIGIALLLLSLAATNAWAHRGPTHSLVAASGMTLVALTACAAFGVTLLYGLLFGLGWFIHLMADSLSTKGLPSLLWPIRESEPTGGGRWVGLLILPIALLGLAGWSSSMQSLLSERSPAESLAIVTPGVPPATSDVALARQRLTEADPKTGAALTNPDTPIIARDGANTSYTWEYLRQTAPNQVVVKKITITLDGSGQIVGASKP
ncbi:MAG: hypothetical protein FD171_1285 [Actinobacteria bacterium]|nr:MAG: hypothetical protein FD171_1285 [Actinomycetota bacterium]